MNQDLSNSTGPGAGDEAVREDPAFNGSAPPVPSSGLEQAPAEAEAPAVLAAEPLSAVEGAPPAPASVPVQELPSADGPSPLFQPTIQEGSAVPTVPETEFETAPVSASVADAGLHPGPGLTRESWSDEQRAGGERPGRTEEPAPNWMLAFVCAWSGGTAVYELMDVLQRTDLLPGMRLFALTGYGTLGAGLFLFTLEALLWGRLRRRSAGQVVLLLIPALLVLAGIVCLFLFNDPDPTRGRI